MFCGCHGALILSDRRNFFPDGAFKRAELFRAISVVMPL